MIYYVYFDSYGDARAIVSELELAEKYQGDPEAFSRACADSAAGRPVEHVTGHVGVMRFEDERELKDFLETLGDEITGFYGCQSDSRPYNF
jgi:hypothetical protein